MTRKPPHWGELNTYAVVHQGEHEFPDDWTEWDEKYAEIQAQITGDEPNVAGNRAGLALIRTSGEEDTEYPASGSRVGPIQEEELISLAASSVLRRMGRSIACAWMNHAWMVTFIEHQDPDVPPQSAKAIRILDLSKYMSPRVLVFSLQCVRCGRVGREEVVQATTIPPQVEEVGQVTIEK